MLDRALGTLLVLLTLGLGYQGCNVRQLKGEIVDLQEDKILLQARVRSLRADSALFRGRADFLEGEIDRLAESSVEQQARSAVILNQTRADLRRLRDAYAALEAGAARDTTKLTIYDLYF